MRILVLMLLFGGALLNAQRNYTKISEKKISAERLLISQKFIEEFLIKCESKDYSAFSNFNLSKRMERFYEDAYQKSCEKSQKLYGKIDLLRFDSAYLSKYSENADPLELFVYQAKTEKIPEIKYISVWIYRDQNYINGIWISREKPLSNKPKITK